MMTTFTCTHSPKSTVVDPSDSALMGGDLTEIWNEDFPDFTYDCLDPLSFSLSTILPPFLMTEPNSCTLGDNYWTYTWETTFENGTILYDEYPMISREDDLNFANSQKIFIDFQDPEFKYIGKMVVKLFATLMKDFGTAEMEFNVDHLPHPCNQTLNTFELLTDQTVFTFTLFSEELERGTTLDIPMTSGLKSDEILEPIY